jgi:hypothetical protein
MELDAFPRLAVYLGLKFGGYLFGGGFPKGRLFC